MSPMVPVLRGEDSPPMDTGFLLKHEIRHEHVERVSRKNVPLAAIAHAQYITTRLSSV